MDYICVPIVRPTCVGIAYTEERTVYSPVDFLWSKVKHFLFQPPQLTFIRKCTASVLMMCSFHLYENIMSVRGYQSPAHENCHVWHSLDLD